MLSINFCITTMIIGMMIFLSSLGAGENGDGPPVFLGKPLPKVLHHRDAYSIRDLFVEDVPGTKSYWLGPWVETVAINGINRFYIIKGYNRFYVNAAFLGDSHMQFLTRSTGIHDFYGPFEGKPSNHFALQGAEQAAP